MRQADQVPVPLHKDGLGLLNPGPDIRPEQAKVHRVTCFPDDSAGVTLRQTSEPRTGHRLGTGLGAGARWRMTTVTYLCSSVSRRPETPRSPRCPRPQATLWPTYPEPSAAHPGRAMAGPAARGPATGRAYCPAHASARAAAAMSGAGARRSWRRTLVEVLFVHRRRIHPMYRAELASEWCFIESAVRDRLALTSRASAIVRTTPKRNFVQPPAVDTDQSHSRLHTEVNPLASARRASILGVRDGLVNPTVYAAHRYGDERAQHRTRRLITIR